MSVYRVGTSGWQYERWRGDFYPAGLPRRSQLTYLSSQLTSLEINGSFYSLQRPSSYQRWHDETPDGFVFAVKGGRFITHMRRLQKVEPALGNFFGSGVLRLDDKLGPFLWQLPASMRFDAATLEEFCALLPTTTDEAVDLSRRCADRPADKRDDWSPSSPRPCRHAIEARHATFEDPAFISILRGHRIACVLSDSAGDWPALDHQTADFSYLRLHGHEELYASGYDDAALDGWAARCVELAAGGRSVYVYFDNDARGRAPHDAQALLERLTRSRADREGVR